MTQPSDLVVITPFSIYATGDLISDPVAITAILAGGNRGNVVAINPGGDGTIETITVVVSAAVTGAAITLAGAVTNAAPVAMDYSIDNQVSWAPVGHYAFNNGNWTGNGPTYATAQSGTIYVRDHANPAAVSWASSFTVTGGAGSNTGTIQLADGSTIDAIGAGLQVGVTPGTVAVSFGTVAGTVADGGALASAQAVAAAALPRAGGTMLGALALAADPVSGAQAATKNYVDTGLATVQTAAVSAQTIASAAATAAASAQATAVAALPSSGGTLTGPLTLPGAPGAALQATTRDYVDSAMASVQTAATGAQATATAAAAAAAAAQATANAALPSTGGTLTGALGFSSGAGTISASANLVLAPVNQLWLGAQAGSGAVYSATIAGVAANPGPAALGKMWNNGGVVCLASAAVPQPVFAAPFLASQSWADVAGSSAIFSHNPVPVPPAPQTGLLFGDRAKLSGVFNFAEVFAPQQTLDAWPALQAYLLYAQLMYLAQKGTVLDNVAERDFVDVLLPAGDFMVAQPLVVPDGVRLGGPGRVLRAPYTANQTNNGTSSVAGPFATTQQLPTVVVVPRGHLSDLNIYCTTDGVFAHRGSGVCLGKNWQASIGAACTIGNAGSGYSVGDLFVAVNPSASPYAPWVAQVTSVNGAGGITAATVFQGGAYALPAACYNGAPGLQAQQWTAANGFSVFDTANPGCFLQKSAFRANFTTPSPGLGATLAPVWVADFIAGGGSYTGGAALTNGIQAGRIQITGGIPDVYDSSGQYGPTFNVMLFGLECEIDSIQGLGGHAGIWATYAQDCRIGRVNFVETNIAFWARGAGSITCANVVLDTCGCIAVIDQSHGIRLHGRAFWEEGNLAINTPLINTQGAALVIGAASNSTYPCSCLDLKFTVINMGGLPASTIAAHPGTSLASYTATQQRAAASLAYLNSSVIDLVVSNTSQYGGAVSPLPTSGIYLLGQNVDPGNDLRGTIDTVPTIDGISPPAQVVALTTGHGFPGCAIRVWDGLHQCWVGPFNTVEMFGGAAPANGTGGTGAGLAMPGSTYVDTASSAGHRYVNTGTQSTPNWV